MNPRTAKNIRMIANKNKVSYRSLKSYFNSLNSKNKHKMRNEMKVFLYRMKKNSAATATG